MTEALHIGIDGSFLSGQMRGHAHYTIELCKELHRQLPNARFFVYSPKEMNLPVQSPRWQLRVGGQLLAFSPIAWLKLYAGKLIAQDRIDLFWGTYYFLPRLQRSVRTITTVYDFAYKITPGTLPFSHALAFHLFLKSDTKRSHAIVSCSQATADRVKTFSGRDATTIIPAIREVFCPQTERQVSDCLNHFGIDLPYLLNIATWEPRKNVDLLARTFIRLKNKGLLPDHQLVLVGKKGWRFEELEAMVTQHSYIRWLDYVPGEHLPALYAGADLFVFPSLYEGFGMPLLEARACGTRAVATDSPELREAGAEDTLYIQLTEESLEQAILEGLQKNAQPLRLRSLPSWAEQGEQLAKLVLSLAHRYEAR